MNDTSKSPLFILSALISQQIRPEFVSADLWPEVIELAMQHGLGPMLLWVAKEGELWIVDPYDGEPLVRVPLIIGQVRSMIFSGAGVWVLDWDGLLQYFRVW